MKALEVIAEAVSHYRRVTERTTPSDYVAERIIARLAERGYFVVKLPLEEQPSKPAVLEYEFVDAAYGDDAYVTFRKES